MSSNDCHASTATNPKISYLGKYKEQSHLDEISRAVKGSARINNKMINAGRGKDGVWELDCSGLARTFRSIRLCVVPLRDFKARVSPANLASAQWLAVALPIAATCALVLGHSGAWRKLHVGSCRQLLPGD